MQNEITVALKARRKSELTHHKAQKAYFANPSPATWEAYREASREFQRAFLAHQKLTSGLSK
jgi:hypothetical protein